VDLDNDGNIDILSGSYSRMETDMAGLFQVLWGTAEGTFKPATALQGTDGEPLIIPADEQNVTEKICTRPTAADLDGDGLLDLVVGTFSGTFYVFHGEGQGRFAPKPDLLRAGDSDLTVRGHGDPFLVDWDADGDLDLVSGSAAGGVFLARNEGSAKEPRFATMEELVAAPSMDRSKVVLGDAHIQGPQTATRVWCDDVNGDGKLDMLVGDTVSLMYPVEGLEEQEVLKQLEAWQAKQDELMQSYPAMPAELQGGGAAAADKADKADETEADDDAADATAKWQEAMNEWQAKYSELYEQRAKIVREERTGFVWVYLQN